MGSVRPAAERSRRTCTSYRSTGAWPWAAWTFLIAAPLIAAWAIIEGQWDPLGAIFLALLWLLYLALLRWHLRFKAHRARGPSDPHGLG